MHPDYKTMTCRVCGDLYIKCHCLHLQLPSAAPSALQRSEVGSSAWVDALARIWERRIKFYEEHPVADPAGNHRQCELAICLAELRAESERASNVRISNDAP